jgi:Dyp-type peroxidase family
MIPQTRPELDDIQGNILKPYAFPAAAHVFVHVGDAEAGRRWLSDRAETVTSAVDWGAAKPPPTTCNVALTFAGLEALGTSRGLLDSFPAAFREGMAARAGRLGDVGASGPPRWELGLGSGSAHVLVTLAGKERPAVEAAARHLGSELGSFGLDVVFEQPAHGLRGSREHFGFADGFSQPTIKGVPATRGADGVPGRFGRQRPLPLGEFVHGYRDLDGRRPPAPAPPFGRNGCYQVWRKLAQDVAGFRAFVRSQAHEHDIGEELLAAKIVGRWPDGSPLALRPHRPDSALAQDMRRINRFDYRHDPDGLRCPVGAHVRRANPRNSVGLGAAMTARHRMIRRGMPYGPPLPHHAEPDQEDRGLIFVAFVADIERQFEFVQQQWCNDGDALRLGSDRDPLIGRGPGSTKMTVPGDPPRFLCPLPEFVTMRGGEYLFVPAISGLRALARGGC